ncbi:MAG: protein jag [Ruminococcus flavefaciens]|nr:protein jag [Ruminococcus flavefaciens]
MTEIFTAKTVEDAKKLAAAKFGKNIKNIDFEVLEEAKKGFFGVGAKDAKVKATYVEEVPEVKNEVNPEINAETEKEAETETSEEKTNTEEVSTVSEEEVENSAENPEIPAETEPSPVEVSIAETTETVVQEESTEKAVETVEKSAGESEDENDYSIENFTLIEDKALMHPKVKLAIDYITSILRAMEIEADFSVYQNENASVIDIKSSSNGTIIGRRGETLDSIQYLCSIIANKGDKDYFRITIDCLGYRKKRKETLEQLAVKVAKQVLRTGRSQPLEPMNPYERRIIHSAVSEINGVNSHSVGEEPYRKIIISSKNPNPNANRRDNRKRDRRDNTRNDRRNSRPRSHDNNNFERKKVDISTSFEKDYKRPKPEDAIEGGLYGKIEL